MPAHDNQPARALEKCLLAGCLGHGGGMDRQGGARTFGGAHHVGAGIAAGEVAIGEAQSRNRAAEALRIGLVDLEARLDRQAAHRCAIGLAFDLERSGRQHDIMGRSVAAQLDVAGDRAVVVDAAGAARAVETIEGEQLADHEPPRGVGIEWLGHARSDVNTLTATNPDTRTTRNAIVTPHSCD